MLYPIQNRYRQKEDLSGVWRCQKDEADVGEQQRWFSELPEPLPIAVPCSWNELYPELKNYLGKLWYQTAFFSKACNRNEKRLLRFESVNYFAKVWMNGILVGEHAGGHLPFEFDVTDILSDGENTLSVVVENELRPDRVPPGNCGGWQAGASTTVPDANFDFFPYAGIHRNVYLLTIPSISIDDVTVVSDIQGRDGLVKINVGVLGNRGSISNIGCELNGIRQETLISDNSAEIEIKIPNAKFWSCESPFLYQLKISLFDSENIVDEYSLKVGVRTIELRGDHLLLNGKSIFLKGFGKHEDFYISGRGKNLPLIIKDHALLKWIGANSYRTSHYPYCEEALQLADEQGILIISETPAVGLRFDDGDSNIDARQKVVLEQIESLVQRDKNHPSVIMWCIANEPCPDAHPSNFAELEKKEGAKGTLVSKPDAAYDYVKQMVDKARQLDVTRPVSFVALLGSPKAWFELSDVVMINRYWGWYVRSANLDEAQACLENEIDQLYSEYQKPIMLSEFGADTVAGRHSLTGEMFSEEFQRDFIECYLKVADSREYIVGAHVWNFADFKTGQGIMRVGGMNLKGVFSRDREPKLAAHFLKDQWSK